MSVQVNAATLQRCADPVAQLSEQAALNLVQTLGGLAPWWLAPEVLVLAARRQPALEQWRSPPPLPALLGSCWIVLVLKQALPRLRRALLLPLRWRAGVTHASRLPRPLRELAEWITRQLSMADWGLDLNDDAGLGDVNLAGLDSDDMGVASGWAALAGGLVLAGQDRLPRTDVWATAAWHQEFGIGKVEGVQDKLALAEEWGVREMFMPAENQVQAWEWLHARGKDLRIEPLMPVARDPDARRILADYLARLGAEPPVEASFQRRKNHYAVIGRREAEDYYWRCLLDDAVARCAASLSQGKGTWQPTHLVTVVGTTPSIVALGPLASGVKRCLLLHEVNEQGQVQEAIRTCMEKVTRRLGATGIECVLGPIRIGERGLELAGIREHMQAFCPGVDPQRLVVDLTPGYKSMSLVLAELAPVGSWLVYCRHSQLEPDIRVDPGTERYERWRQEGREKA